MRGVALLDFRLVLIVATVSEAQKTARFRVLLLHLTIGHQLNYLLQTSHKTNSIPLKRVQYNKYNKTKLQECQVNCLSVIINASSLQLKRRCQSELKYNYPHKFITMDTPLSVPEIYSLVNNKLNSKGVEGYHVEKKYVDCAQIMKDREMLANLKKGMKDRRHVTKRGNFLEDQQNAHKAIPGPGKYEIIEQWPQKSKLKIHYPDKMTYVDEIMKHEKKQKKPAPGQYNVIKTQKQVEADKKKIAQKKIPYQDRISYLDEIQYEANTTPGVGNYNPRDRVKTQTSVKTKPEDWRKKHQLQQKKKPEKSPEVGTYNPQPSDYTLFQSNNKPKVGKNYLGKVERFKTAPSGSGLPPAKYTVLQEWKGKDNGKVIRHGLESLSTKKTAKSVYYH